MFRENFKYYKSKKPPPDLTSVINVSLENDNIDVMPIKSNLFETNCQEQLIGLIDAKNWKVYTLKNKPGLLFIKNPFTALGQRYWIKRCLQDFSKKPQKLNLDIHDYLLTEENWWDVCTTDQNRSEFLLNKLRWATLGYHHNWDTKIYSETSKDIFPEDLACLCEYIARILGFGEYSAEAAIINYYPMNSTLSGHTDHSEQNLDAPLFSFSFGQSAIFLIGGLTEEYPALPMLIESGDIIIMSKESRLCYHAVPKILTASNQPWNFKCDANKNYCNLLASLHDEITWKDFDNYVNRFRININVRQVLKSDQKTLNHQT